MAIATGWWEVRVLYDEPETYRFLSQERAERFFRLCEDDELSPRMEYVDPTSMDDIPF